VTEIYSFDQFCRNPEQRLMMCAIVASV